MLVIVIAVLMLVLEIFDPFPFFSRSEPCDGCHGTRAKHMKREHGTVVDCERILTDSERIVGGLEADSERIPQESDRIPVDLSRQKKKLSAPRVTDTRNNMSYVDWEGIIHEHYAA